MSDGHRYTRHGWPCCPHVTGPRPPVRARCGGPSLCTRCASELSGCPTRPAAVVPVMRRHRYTRHGWACCGEASGPQPTAVARCGGPLMCARCRRDAAVCPARQSTVADDIDFAALESLYRAPHPNLSHLGVPEHLHRLAELVAQAIAVHHLLDRCDVARGDGLRGDLDARMWLLAGQYQAMRDQLARIAEQHQKHIDDHGGSDGGCRECGLVWPCPTHVWASTRRGVCDPWDDRFSV